MPQRGKRKAEGYLLAETLAGMTLFIFLLISVLFAGIRITAALRGGLQAMAARERLYEFIDYFGREVQEADNIIVPPGGTTIEITSWKSGKLLRYYFDENSKGGGFYVNETRLFDASGAEFGFNNGLAYASVRLPQGGGVSLYAYQLRRKTPSFSYGDIRRGFRF